MVQLPRIQAKCLVAIAGAVLIVALAGYRAPLGAQSPPVHYLHAGLMPPGAIGARQLQRGGPLPGYFQPVEIKAPSGALISPARDGRFDRPNQSTLKLGLAISAVYRLRVTDIPDRPGLEVYPTIEVIDRTYPPVGQELQFPIPIELAQEELEIALAGQFVTRVIYLEDPDTALPAAQNPGEQIVFEAAAGDDPLAVADRLGRPVAILRLGGRVPDAGGIDQQFLYGSPGYIRFGGPAAAAARSGPAAKQATGLRQPKADGAQTAAAYEPVGAPPAPGEARSSRAAGRAGTRTASANEPLPNSAPRGPQAAEIAPAIRAPRNRGYQVFTLPSAASEQP